MRTGEVNDGKAMLILHFQGVSELLPFNSSNLNKTALKVCIYWVV